MRYILAIDTAVGLSVGAGAQTIGQAISTDILHFLARGLVIQGGKGYSR